MNSKVDPRVIRTRRLLFHALIDLIISEGVDSVTIRKIVEKAEVNRSTFYLHFKDKQDILTQLQDEFLDELEQIMINPTYDYNSAKNEFKRNKLPIKTTPYFFEHIQNNAAIYRKMLHENEFREKVVQRIKDETLKYRESLWEATFLANGTVGIISYWLENGMEETVLEMSLWFTKIYLFPLGEFE
jgi:AcrR family transcriptional regulator